MISLIICCTTKDNKEVSAVLGELQKSHVFKQTFVDIQIYFSVFFRKIKSMGQGVGLGRMMLGLFCDVDLHEAK